MNVNEKFPILWITSNEKRTICNLTENKLRCETCWFFISTVNISSWEQKLVEAYVQVFQLETYVDTWRRILVRVLSPLQISFFSQQRCHDLFLRYVIIALPFRFKVKTENILNFYIFPCEVNFDDLHILLEVNIFIAGVKRKKKIQN